MDDCKSALNSPGIRVKGGDPLAPPEPEQLPGGAGAKRGWYGRRVAAPHPAIIRYAGRHVGFLTGLLLAGVTIGIAYRYLVDPLEERTLPFYMRSACMPLA